MCKSSNKCNGCRYCRDLSIVHTIVCNAPQSSKEHPDYDKYKDLFYTEDCPLKEIENEFIYWS